MSKHTMACQTQETSVDDSNKIECYVWRTGTGVDRQSDLLDSYIKVIDDMVHLFLDSKSQESIDFEVWRVDNKGHEQIMDRCTVHRPKYMISGVVVKTQMSGTLYR